MAAADMADMADTKVVRPCGRKPSKKIFIFHQKKSFQASTFRSKKSFFSIKKNLYPPPCPWAPFFRMYRAVRLVSRLAGSTFSNVSSGSLVHAPRGRDFFECIERFAWSRASRARFFDCLERFARSRAPWTLIFECIERFASSRASRARFFRMYRAVRLVSRLAGAVFSNVSSGSPVHAPRGR